MSAPHPVCGSTSAGLRDPLDDTGEVREYAPGLSGTRLWRPRAGTWRIRSDRVAAAGLTCRPLADTVADTWRWPADGGAPYATGTPARRAAAEIGVDPARESLPPGLLASARPAVDPTVSSQRA